MTPLVWANFPLALAFVLAIVGIPLWMTFKRPSKPADHSQANAYLAAKAAPEGGQAQDAGPAASGTRVLTRRAVRPGEVPARRRAGKAPREVQHSA